MLDFFVNKTFKDHLNMEQVKNIIQITDMKVKGIWFGKLKKVAVITGLGVKIPHTQILCKQNKLILI